MLANLCEKEGLFTAAGKLMAKGSKGDPKRLLTLVFVAAALTTAVLSLDATVVLLTPGPFPVWWTLVRFAVPDRVKGS